MNKGEKRMTIESDRSLRSFDPRKQVLIIEKGQVLKAENRYGFLGWRAVRRRLSSNYEYNLEKIAKELLEKMPSALLRRTHYILNEQISTTQEASSNRIKNIQKRLLNPIAPEHRLALIQKAFIQWASNDELKSGDGSWSFRKDMNEAIITQNPGKQSSFSITFTLEGPPSIFIAGISPEAPRKSIPYSQLTEIHWQLIGKAFNAVAMQHVKTFYSNEHNKAFFLPRLKTKDQLQPEIKTIRASEVGTVSEPKIEGYVVAYDQPLRTILKNCEVPENLRKHFLSSIARDKEAYTVFIPMNQAIELSYTPSLPVE